jgi:hypothetical protein
MAVVIIDGRVAVAFCTSIATTAAPTVAEINAGTRLETYITPDGLEITTDTTPVPTSNLGSTVDTERAGRRKPSISIKFHHDGTSDVAWNLLPYRTNGFLVVRRGIDRTTAFASTQKVQVYPVEAGESNEQSPAPNTSWDFTVPMYITADFEPRAVVA